MNLAEISISTADALSLGVGGLGMDVRDAIAPRFLQQDGSWLSDLLPVIIFMVISIVPSLVQARKKAKERQGSGSQPPAKSAESSTQSPHNPTQSAGAANRNVQPTMSGQMQPALQGQTESQDRASAPRSSRQPTSQTTRQTAGQTAGQPTSQATGNDLESRVKRYFEELVGPPEATPPSPPRPPARPQPTSTSSSPPRTPSPTRSGSLVDAHIELGNAHIELSDAHIELKGLDRKKLPSREAQQRDVPQRARSQSGAQKGRSRRIHPLLRGRSLRSAIVLREVFGPPKSLE